MNLCGLVKLKIISPSVINLIKSSFLSANYKFNISFHLLACRANERWFQIRLVFSRFLDVCGNLEISDYTSLVPGIHVKTLLQAVSYCQRISQGHGLMVGSSQQRCSIKNVMLKISQNLKGNAWVRASFLINLQTWSL